MKMSPAECKRKTGHCWLSTKNVGDHEWFKAGILLRRRCRHCGLEQRLKNPEYEDMAVVG